VVSLVGILDAAARAGRLSGGHQDGHFPAALAADLATIRAQFDLEMSQDLIARGLLVWSALFGAVSFEVFNQYGPDTFAAPGELFEYHLSVLGGVAGLEAADS
jgi:hypothetical protein